MSAARNGRRAVGWISALALALWALPLYAVHPALGDPASVLDGTGGGSDAPYRLGTGDKVRVIVFGEDDLGGEFQIDDGGFVRLPLIGEMRAAELSPRELERRIASALADGYLNSPRVSVEVTDYRPFYIIGEVNKPGQYAYVNDMRAPNAIALAGGYTVKASDSTICVRRGGEKKEECLPAEVTTRIEPGDVVRVPPTAFWAAITFAGPLSAIISTRWYLPEPPQ